MFSWFHSFIVFFSLAQGAGTLQSHEKTEPHNISFVVDHFCRYQVLQDQPDPLAVGKCCSCLPYYE